MLRPAFYRHPFVLANGKIKSLKEGLLVHVCIIKTPFRPTIFISNQLIELYSKNGHLQEARHLFDKMPERNVFSWNAMIHGHISNKDLKGAQLLFDSAPDKDSVTYNSMISGYVGGEGHEDIALQLFAKMQENRTRIDEFTLTTMLNLAAKLSVLSYGRQIHSYMLKTANNSNGFGASSLIDMYSKCGCFLDAFQAFQEMGFIDSISKNAMVAACCREGKMELALDLFQKVLATNDAIAWNTLISGYAENGFGEIALNFFVQMAENGIRYNEHTFASVLSACSSLKNLKCGKEIHACVLKNGFISNPFISSGIVDVYCKCDNLWDAESVRVGIHTENVFSITSMIMGHCHRGNMVEAQSLFNSLSEKTSVSWTALLSGYLRFRQCDAVFELFRELKRTEMAVLDPLILISVLGACAIQATLYFGKQIHTYVVKMKVVMDEKLGSALVDMYAKCGEIKYSEEIFHRVSSRDRVLYNTMIAGFAHHGRENEAIRLFEEMLERDIRPDAITFVALLSACRHAGYVEKGEKYFYTMIDEHGISPEINHYSCMVDLFGRANRLDKAVTMMEDISVEPDAILWGTFLNACRLNGNTELVREAEETLLRIERDNGARYVQLGNVYAAEGEWSEMARIRRKMRGREVKKIAGCSWVYVENKVQIFTSGYRFCSEAEAIYAVLASLYAEMMEENMSPGWEEA